MSQKSPLYPLAITALAAIAAILLLVVPSSLGTAGRLLFGIPLLLVFPGYVMYFLLFRTSDGLTTEYSEQQSDTGPRNKLLPLAIAISFSVVLVPILIRIVMIVRGYSDRNVVVSVAVFVIVLGAVGAFLSRSALRVQPAKTVLSSIPERIRTYFHQDSNFGLATRILLIVSIVFFLGSIGLAVSEEPTDEAYTEFYLLNTNDSGELVASDYPTTLNETESTQLVVGIENYEQEPVTYTLVIEVQRLANQSVVAKREALRTRRSVEPDGTERIEYRVVPQMGGGDLKIQYYLYRGPAPANPSVESAYRTVHLSVDVMG